MKPKAPKTPIAKESRILELYALAKAGKWDDVLSAMGQDRQLAVSCSRHVKPGSGWTFLHQAAYAGHALAARALIGLGANVEARGADGLIPMDVALSRGFEELATTLRGANAGGLWTPSPDESVLASSYVGNVSEPRRALLPIKVAYGGAIITIPAGSRYYVDEFERVIVGWHGSYDPPGGM
jgi:uncharacterized protein